MTFVVPFDGSELAEAALIRALEFRGVLDEEIVVVSVVPDGNAKYARSRGWIDEDAPFELDAVVANLREQAEKLAPMAEFQSLVVDRYAPSGTIGTRIRKFATESDASMTFIGSTNAGRLVSSISSVGSTVATDDAYDIVIVRSRRPLQIREERERTLEPE